VCFDFFARPSFFSPADFKVERFFQVRPRGPLFLSPLPWCAAVLFLRLQGAYCPPLFFRWSFKLTPVSPGALILDHPPGSSLFLLSPPDHLALAANCLGGVRVQSKSARPQITVPPFSDLPRLAFSRRTQRNPSSTSLRWFTFLVSLPADLVRHYLCWALVDRGLRIDPKAISQCAAPLIFRAKLFHNYFRAICSSEFAPVAVPCSHFFY